MEKLETSIQQLEELKEKIHFMLDDQHFQRKQYAHIKDWEQKKDIIYWGQRKLFLSELWFLTKYGHLASTVVYAGAAPGYHITFLACLFPTHIFRLVDPRECHLKKISNDPTNARERIESTKIYFTDEIATQIAKMYPEILFISDIIPKYYTVPYIV